MARAALGWSAEKAADKISVTKQALASYEREERKLSNEKVELLETIFIRERIYFGPCHGVCVGHNGFRTERWLADALYRLLTDAGIYPSSRDLIEAGKNDFPGHRRA